MKKKRMQHKDGLERDECFKKMIASVKSKTLFLIRGCIHNIAENWTQMTTQDLMWFDVGHFHWKPSLFTQLPKRGRKHF